MRFYKAKNQENVTLIRGLWSLGKLKNVLKGLISKLFKDFSLWAVYSSVSDCVNACRQSGCRTILTQETVLLLLFREDVYVVDWLGSAYQIRYVCVWGRERIIDPVLPTDYDLSILIQGRRMDT